MSNAIDNLIHCIEEAAEHSTQLPVQITNSHGATLGMDMRVAISFQDWSRIIDAVEVVQNDFTENAVIENPDA